MHVKWKVHIKSWVLLKWLKICEIHLKLNFPTYKYLYNHDISELLKSEEDPSRGSLQL